MSNVNVGGIVTGDCLDAALAALPIHPAAVVTNNASPFSWNAATQTLNVPKAPTLVANANGSFTFTAGDGSAPVVIPADCCPTLVDNGDGTYTFTNGSGGTITFSVSSHPAAAFTNNAAPFAWNSVTQAGNIPQSPVLALTASGFTFTSGNGSAPVVFADKYVSGFSISGNTATLTLSDGTTLTQTIPTTVDINVQSFNLSGSTLTLTETDGTVHTVTIPADTKVSAVSFNPATGLLTITNSDGTTVTTTINVCAALQLLPTGTAGIAGATVVLGNDCQWHVLPSVADPRPVVNFEVQKAGLVGQLVATGFTTQVGSSIVSYAWSGTGVTFASPTSAATTYTVQTVGCYSISLTVTNSEGQSYLYGKNVRHGYDLHVGYIDSEHYCFYSVQQAWDWVVANDSAGGANYVVNVWGVTTDSGVITAPAFTTRLVMHPSARIAAAINYGATASHFIYGQQERSTQISGTTGSPTIKSTGANITLSNINIAATDATVSVIDVDGGALNMELTTVIHNSSLIAATIYAIKHVSTTSLGLRIQSVTTQGHCLFSGVLLNTQSRDLLVQPTSNNATFGIHFDRCGGEIRSVNVRVTTTGSAGVGNFAHILVTKHASVKLQMTDILISSIRTGPAGSRVSGLEVTGTGASVLSAINLNSVIPDAGTADFYGIARVDATVNNELYVDGYLNQKTNALINLVAGVATALQFPAFDFVFDGSGAHPTITFPATVPNGSNYLI